MPVKSPADKVFAVCGNCGHDQNYHQAIANGFRRGALGEKIQNINWNCKLCPSDKPCPKFVPKIEVVKAGS